MAPTTRLKDGPAANRKVPGLPSVALYVLLAVCTLSLLAELAIPGSPHFGFDGYFGFHALLGLASAGALTLLAVALGMLLKRREDDHDD